MQVKLAKYGIWLAGDYRPGSRWAFDEAIEESH